MSEELDELAEYIANAGHEAAQALLFELITGLADEVDALKTEIAFLRANRNNMPLIGDGRDWGGQWTIDDHNTHWFSGAVRAYNTIYSSDSAQTTKTTT